MLTVTVFCPVRDSILERAPTIYFLTMSVDIRHFSIQNFFIICLYFFLPFYVTMANIHPQNQHYDPPHHAQKFFRDPTNFDSRVSGIDKTVLEVF